MKVKKRRCKEPFCLKVATYHYRRASNKFCEAHKLPGMTDKKHLTCKVVNCFNFAIYGYNYRAIAYCTTHSTPDMKFNRLCKKTDCNNIPELNGERFDMHCKEHQPKPSIDSDDPVIFPVFDLDTVDILQCEFNII